MHPKTDIAAPRLDLRSAAERLVERWGVFLRCEVTGLPPIAARGPKGEPLFAVADLDNWAAALPRRGRATYERAQPRGEDVTDNGGKLLFNSPPPSPWHQLPAESEAEAIFQPKADGGHSTSSL
jgi:hypothetical protein